jgi:DNA-binding response OmpR family regulator
MTPAESVGLARNVTISTGGWMERIRRVLIVDDEPQAVRSFQRHLWRVGFETDVAFDGLEARSRLLEAASRETPFHLMILDLLMPGMNGFELFKWVKQNQPLTSVILVSAFGDTDSILESIRNGFDGFGQKPFTPRKLMQLIEAIEQTRTTEPMARRQARGSTD